MWRTFDAKLYTRSNWKENYKHLLTVFAKRTIESTYPSHTDRGHTHNHEIMLELLMQGVVVVEGHWKNIVGIPSVLVLNIKCGRKEAEATLSF